MAAVYYHMGRFPPDDRLDWPRLVPFIGPATAAVARYDGMLAAIPHPGVLLAPPHHPRSRALLAHFLEPLGHCGRSSNALTFTHDTQRCLSLICRIK